MKDTLIALCTRARDASHTLALNTTAEKNQALLHIIVALKQFTNQILEANGADVARARSEGISESMIDRLTLTPERIGQIIEGIETIITLPDPVGDPLADWKAPSGINIQKVRVPIGVVGIIYESRPNVTVDTAALTLKSGNSVILRGSSSAIATNKVLVSAIRSALRVSTIPEDAVLLIEDTSRETADIFMKLYGYVDALVPRGGAKLIQHVVANSSIPVIETGAGNCHMYLHKDAPYDMAEKLVLNAKTQRPSVCNAIETVLIHKNWPAAHTRKLLEALKGAGVECRVCSRCKDLVPALSAATESDWGEEFLDLVVAVKIVDSVHEAIDHIRRYGTKHSEAIITTDNDTAELFLQSVDAAAVYHNASTRFTDGFEFGFGAELGISTQKLHARGPLGLPELTSSKYIIRGNGEARR